VNRLLVRNSIDAARVVLASMGAEDAARHGGNERRIGVAGSSPFPEHNEDLAMTRSLSLLLGAAAALACVTACRDEHGIAGPAPTSSGAPSAASPPPPAPLTAPIADAKLASALEEAFALDPVLHAAALRASVANGAVTIAGSVPTLAAKWRAARLAATFKGATAVTNGIVVSSPARPDAELSKAVNEAIKLDPATRNAKVEVTASASTVTMRGAADSYMQRKLLTDLASRVRGVQDVNTTAVILTRAADRSDAEVLADVEDRLREDAMLDGTQVTAAVHGRGAALSGVVGSLAQRDAAVADVETAGVTTVDTQALRVDWSENDRAMATAQQPPPSDQRISETIGRRLSDDGRVGAPFPTVHVDQGVTTLSGTVMDFRADKAAIEDTRGVRGVSRIEDRMTVVPAEHEGDAAIQALVLRSIYEDTTAPDSRNVRVTTVGARVTLEGPVASEVEQRELVYDVEGVPGVVAVDDRLQVQGYGTQTHPVQPGWLQHRIAECIWWDPRVGTNKVTVDVTPAGEATLSGTVDSAGEARAANDDAVRAGAAHVQDHLRVTGAPPPATAPPGR
jgi:osmotically-inducible protein OsmY